MIRFARPLSLAVCLLASVSFVAEASAKAKKPAKPAASESAAGKPLLVGTFGDWGAYTTANGKAKVCYALGKPKERQPEGLKRNDAFVFISRRSAEGVKNEISVGMGFPLKEGAVAGTAEVSILKVDLVAKGENAWVKNVADESALLEAMKKGARLVVKAASKKGNVTTDSYSLNGLAQAWDRVLKDCP